MIESLTAAAKPYADAFRAACAEFDIRTPIVLAHFAAQCAHESGGFRSVVEGLNYSAPALRKTWPSRFNEVDAKAYARQPERIANRAYASRMGNGPESSGEGWRYRGRGLIQVTGKNNYRRLSVALFGDERLLASPDWLAEPAGACRSAAHFWSSDPRLTGLALNDKLDEISGIINTGSPNGQAHGMDSRRLWLKLAKKAAGV